MTVTANDLYALGLALGNILRDVDPATRTRALELVRLLERKAEHERASDYPEGSLENTFMRMFEERMSW